jgi:membrane fusion protein (multidrug efflux system)
VSKTAVTRDSKGDAYVFVVSNDKTKVKKQKVSVGEYTYQGIIVLDGLTPGQLVVVEGKQKLTDNSLIRL